MPKMKLKDAADLISDLDMLIRDDHRRARYEKARFLVRKGVIAPDEPVSQGQTGEFGLEAVCSLRLCFSLYDNGLDPATVAKIAPVFHHPVSPARSLQPPEAISWAIEAVRNGTEVTFSVVTERQQDQLEPSRESVFRIGSDVVIPETVRSPIMDSISTVVGTLSVDVGRLFQPVISHFDDLTKPGS